MAGYAVKELFLTLQGEGMQAGRRAVFVRFAGCNLWSGRERDRAGADCTFCDTDFVGTDGEGGGRFVNATTLAWRIEAMWQTDLAGADILRFVVLTGGEPLLQVDTALLDALHARRFEIAVESNGTIVAPAGIDWLCVSPKAGTTVVQRTGDELKLVWPQPKIDHHALESWDFNHFLVQPMDGPDAADTLAAAIRFVGSHPLWRLSIQTHKLIGVR